MLTLLLAAISVLPNQLGWRNGTPNPVLDGDPEFVGLYWKAWENVQAAIVEDTRVGSLPPRFLASHSSLSFEEIVGMTTYLRWAYQAVPLEPSLQFVLSKISPNGQAFSLLDLDTLETIGLSNGIPLTGLALWSTFQMTGNSEYLRLNVAPALRRHAFFEDAYKNAEKERALPLNYRPFIGQLPDPNLPDSAEAISLLLMDTEFLMRCATAAKIKDGQSVLKRMRDEEVTGLEKLWNSESETYRASNKEKTVFEPISVIPIWAVMTGAVRAEHADKMLKKLSQPEFFSARMPYPSVPSSFELNSTVNPQHAYFCVKALMSAGKRSEAGYAAESMLSAYAREAGSTKTLYSPFESNTRAPSPLAERDSLQAGHVAIGVLIEALLGFDVNAKENLLTWWIWRTDRHGIERLRFGDNCVTMICGPRASRSAPLEISIEAEKPFLLRIKSNSYEKVHKIPAGASKISVG